MLRQVEQESSQTDNLAGFRETISPDWALVQAGYKTWGVVVLIRDRKTGKLLWTRSAIDRLMTGNGVGQWQCGICETREGDEDGLLDTAFRGLKEELGPEVENNINLVYLGEAPFLPCLNIMARVFIGDWKGKKNFTGFSFPDGEVDRAEWVLIGRSYPGGKVRPGSAYVLGQLGMDRLRTKY